MFTVTIHHQKYSLRLYPCRCASGTADDATVISAPPVWLEEQRARRRYRVTVREAAPGEHAPLRLSPMVRDGAHCCPFPAKNTTSFSAIFRDAAVKHFEHDLDSCTTHPEDPTNRPGGSVLTSPTLRHPCMLWLILNVTTVLAGISIASSVAGFLPVRAGRRTRGQLRCRF